MAHVEEVERSGCKPSYIVRWRDNSFKQRSLEVKREAERFALKVESDPAESQSTDRLVKTSKTIADIVAASMTASAPGLKPRTRQSYETIYRNRILPTFGERRASTVTRAEVQAWVVKLHPDRLSQATVHHHYVALKKAFKHALHDRLIDNNPCDGVTLPKTHAADGASVVFLTAVQIERLATRLEAVAPRDLLVRFAAFTGLRAAGLAGLRVRDLDLTAGHVSVRQTMQRIAGRGLSERRSRDGPPTTSSSCTVD